MFINLLIHLLKKDLLSFLQIFICLFSSFEVKSEQIFITCEMKHVKKIGSDALPPSQVEQRTEYKYPATIELEEQTFKIQNGSALPLQVGMSLSANIKLRKVSYLQLLFSNFEKKTDALKRF